MCVDESLALKLSFRHTFSEIIELNKYAPEVRLKAYLVLSMALLPLLAVLVMILRSETISEWIPVLEVIGVWILLGMMTTRLVGLGAWIRSNRPRLSIEFGPARVLVKIDNRMIDLSWKDCGYFYETPRLIVLRVPGDAIAIPKRAGELDEILSLLSLLQKKLPTRPPSWRWYVT